MNIFKRIKKYFKKADWDDITLEKFYKIQDVLASVDEYTENNIKEIVYGIDTSDMSITELSKYDISFLEKELPLKNVKLKHTYVLNGREYDSNINLTMIRTNQFIDFTTYTKEKDIRYEKLLSVFIVPKGHKYNDGYNITEVQEDILQMPIAVVQSLAFFMMEQFRAFAVIFQRYLETEAKTMPKELQKITTETAKTIKDLVSFQF